MDDEDELLNSAQCTDDESLSESEDQCVPPDRPEDSPISHLLYTEHSLAEFFTVKIVLLISSAAIAITLPLYMEAMNDNSDSYSMIIIDTSTMIVILSIAVFFSKQFQPKFKTVDVIKPPIAWPKLVLASMVYTLAGFMVVYAVDRKRVMCHIQDPVKGLVLVFSLISYFLFSKKMMGLRRIFATTTIIIGLFISVDYGLCDEFRCRGNEREHRIDDAGPWSWKTHGIWAAVYIMGLFLFSAFFTLLDRYLNSTTLVLSSNTSTHLLATVSRVVASQTAHQTRSVASNPTSRKYISSVHLSLYIHSFTWIFAVGLFQTGTIDTIGKASNATQLLTFVKNGLECHFTNAMMVTTRNCGHVALYGWVFLFFYLVFNLSTIRFLVMSQSAVHTVATVTSSLPLVGIWWSLFKMVPIGDGLMVWSPSVTGELICSILGAPIVAIGLALLSKSHVNDLHQSRMNSNWLVSKQLA